MHLPVSSPQTRENEYKRTVYIYTMNQLFETAINEKYEEYTPPKASKYNARIRLIDLWNELKHSQAYEGIWKEMRKIRKKDFDKWAEERFQITFSSRGKLVNLRIKSEPEPIAEPEPEPTNQYEMVMMERYERYDTETRLREMWEDFTQSNFYKTLSYNDKRKHNRDAYYHWASSAFPITGNKKTGKLVKGLRRKDIYL